MKKFARFCIISVILLLSLLTACNFQAARTPDEAQSQDVLFTQAAQTVVAAITQTAEAAPAEQPILEPPPEAEETQATEEPEGAAGVQDAPILGDQPPTETPTLTPTPSETVSAWPMITGQVNTNCRFGPDPTFEILGYLLEGETSEVHGKDRNGYWWYIANPDVSGGFCWVWTETTSVTGDIASLAIIEPPPTYTPTPSDTPTPTATATTDSYP